MDHRNDYRKASPGTARGPRRETRRYDTGPVRQERMPNQQNTGQFYTGSVNNSEGTGRRPDLSTTGRMAALGQQTAPLGRTNPLNRQAVNKAVPREKNTEYYLHLIEEKLKNARKLPLSEQCVVDRMELLILIDNARKTLPDDLRRAKWLLEQNHNLIAETRKEAEKIMRDAEQEIAKMIDEHEITQAAQDEAQRIMEDAGMESQRIHEQAKGYADHLLDDLEAQLTEMLIYVRSNRV